MLYICRYCVFTWDGSILDITKVDGYHQRFTKYIWDFSCSEFGKLSKSYIPYFTGITALPQNYTITKGVVQGHSFNTTADFKFWGWDFSFRTSKFINKMNRIIEGKELCPVLFECSSVKYVINLANTNNNIEWIISQYSVDTSPSLHHLSLLRSAFLHWCSVPGVQLIFYSPFEHLSA